MNGIGDALKAIRRAILLEERITSQSKKLEQLALSVVEMDKRLAALEGRMDGFLAAGSRFSRRGWKGRGLANAGPNHPARFEPARAALYFRCRF